MFYFFRYTIKLHWKCTGFIL